jgi:hypothetical protein
MAMDLPRVKVPGEHSLELQDLQLTRSIARIYWQLPLLPDFSRQATSVLGHASKWRV